MEALRGNAAQVVVNDALAMAGSTFTDAIGVAKEAVDFASSVRDHGRLAGAL